MLPAGHNRSAAGCEATGGTGRIVGAIDPHTDSRGRTTLGLPMRRHMQHGEGGDRAGPILGPPCGDNRQTHLGGRGPPGCSGERDRWLPLGGDDLNKRTRVSLSVNVVTNKNPCVTTLTFSMSLQLLTQSSAWTTCSCKQLEKR
jgi:hypothetical protein